MMVHPGVDTLMIERKNVMNFLEEENGTDRSSELGRKRSADVDEASPKPKQRRTDSSSRHSEERKKESETKSETTETENGSKNGNEPISVGDDSSIDEPSKDEGIGSKETGMDVVDLTSDNEEESKTKVLDQKKKMLLKKMLLAKMKAKSADSDESSSDEDSEGEDSGEDSEEDEDSNDSDVIVEKVVERPKEIFQSSRTIFIVDCSL